MKIQRLGNALFVQVPEKFGFKEGDEVVAMKGENGSFFYFRQLGNCFSSKSFNYSEESKNVD